MTVKKRGDPGAGLLQYPRGPWQSRCKEKTSGP